MKKTIVSLIFSNLFALALSASPVLISEDSAISLKAASNTPITVSANFEIQNADLILVNKKMAKLKLLKKGFVFIPLVQRYKGTVVLSAKDGKIYTINIQSGGEKSVLQLEDPLQTLKPSNKKIELESEKIDYDARNIIKAILLGKNLHGFKKTMAHQTIKSEQFTLTRYERYTGSKYVVDGWKITNITPDTLYFREADFYTEGILAIALQRHRVLKGESIYLYMLLNKNSVYNAEKAR